MSDIFKYSEGHPRFVNCRAMKVMDVHNSRVLDAASQRIKRYNDQHKAMAIQVIHSNSDAALVDLPGWLRSAFEKVRHTNGSFRMLNFRLRLGRLLIEFQSAGRSSSE